MVVEPGDDFAVGAVGEAGLVMVAEVPRDGACLGVEALDREGVAELEDEVNDLWGCVSGCRDRVWNASSPSW